jgi:hypothetical protein
MADSRLAASCAVAIAALAGAAPARASPQAPWVAVVEHVLTWPAGAGAGANAGPGPTARELSALAWDPRARELVAVSDRGRLFRYRLALQGGQWRAEQVMAQRLDLGVRAGGQAQLGSRNVEALAWHRTGPDGAGELLVAPEQGDHVTRLGAEGQVLGTLAWPTAVAAALARAGAEGQRHGVEAIAWHDRHGLLAATQRPTRSPPRAAGGAERLHWIHAASGARWGFAASGRDSHLKAIESLPDGTLLLLERTQARGDERLHTVLRWLDLGACGEARLCAAPLLPMQPAPIVGPDNVEGLACNDEGTCWLVSDGGAGDKPPTRMWQFRLARPAAAQGSPSR